MQEQQFYIVDQIQTNNGDTDCGQKISSLWERASKILDNYPKERYGIYHNYESNYHGNYTLSIATLEFITDNRFVIPKQTYQIFPSKTYQDVLKTWQSIWQLEDKNELQRAYSFDFERYKLDGSVDIYVAIQ